MGEGAGGAGRQGQQVRRQGVLVPGAGGRRQHRRGGGADAGAHGSAGAGRRVLGCRVAGRATSEEIIEAFQSLLLVPLQGCMGIEGLSGRGNMHSVLILRHTVHGTCTRLVDFVAHFHQGLV